ncbi:carbohydrate kinase family protein [Streptacidiphilus jiangxiensis]|uniref:Fructokinase n=1 Tax=Streptacidiphilus jiangxiensis TaxID=235985 RepID=A0A1H7QYL3_STRJI|nr:carbohydrate kinase [Streptacidiphilus jiangxiensis]SEL53023.1 fructokinase [Streptacidiphilus jiangxiensis]
MSDFLVIGESVADIVRAPGRADVPHPGGSPANVAYGLARLGHDATLLTQLGDDAMGGLIRAHLESAGVRLTDDGQRGVRTPTAVVSLDGDGKASYAFDIAWTLRPVALAGPPPAHVHLGSIAAVAHPGADAALALVEELREHATVSYDPNVRPALMGERAEALRQVERCVAAADVVKASDEDLSWLYPDEPEASVAARWLAAGPSLVLATRGAAGAVAYTRTHTVAAPAGRATVVDTVGAGDSFMSATLHTLRALAPDRAGLAALDRAGLATVLHWATVAAALTVSRAGANPPTAAELAATPASVSRGPEGRMITGG